MSIDRICLSCSGTRIRYFFEQKQVPAHVVLLMSSRQEALGYPKGDIRLGICLDCGFVGNYLYDDSLHEYSQRYEETQGYSATFNRFLHELTADLIEKYDLRGKRILEIGCGKGEFLHLLCEMGNNQGLGLDPAYIPGRDRASTDARVSFKQEMYSSAHAHPIPDCVVCKMTLEHISGVGKFIRQLHRDLAASTGTLLFFQVPNAKKVFSQGGFWDVYYEHTSYFSAGSLGRLFRNSGFQILDLYSGYDDQYLMITARPLAAGEIAEVHPLEESPEELLCEVEHFRSVVMHKRQEWRSYIMAARARGERVVLWSGASKSVAFLSLLELGDEIEYAVDINPNKHGFFMPGTGQEVVAPEFLAHYQPDLVIAMNPVYLEEIQLELDRLGVGAKLISAEAEFLDHGHPPERAIAATVA